ncbi:hypothetical protein IFM89_019284 [Coptis chinensis]|uniref:H15 domain-containing protein n=1 Tax=Coptis chinensis TaxID=261450 RepID=A0A835H662_9MAGN|nr:hypothetical protein IFM89_019284 [Coptis chinensis]
MESSVVSVIPPAQAHMAHALTQPLKPSSNHPPYAEMIVSAIKALKEKKGSSKKAIAKYIDSTYVNLPQSHSALLTHHLKRLKKNGMVLMVKHSYKLPNSSVGADGVVKRGRGRPPKPIGPDATVVVGGPEKRGRGRPPTKVAKPKVTGPGGVVKRGRGRPPKPIVGPVVDGEKRGRGRPKKNAHADNTVPLITVSTNTVPLITVSTTPVVNEEVVVSRGRPRGRPAKASGGPPKTKSVSTGRPVGRPRKSSGPIIVPSPVPVVE